PSTHPSGTRREPARHPDDRAAGLPRPGGARLAGAGHPHRLRGPPKGGVLVRRAVRHPSPVHRVGRHGRGWSEHPRRRRSVSDRPGRPRGADAARPPAALRRRPRLRAGGGSPPLYAWRPMSGGIAIVGAGYVGVPLAQVFAEAGHSVLLLDVDAARVEQLNRGESYIEDVPSETLGRLVRDHGLRATTDYDELRERDAILVALPTPL